jgi:hypothetical protein
MNPSARQCGSLLAISLVLFMAGPAFAQDAPLKIRFLDRDPNTTARPGLFAKLRLRLEFENAADEPRWIVTTLDRATKLDAKFTPLADADLPFFSLQSAADGKQVVLVGFLGEPRFTAVRLPAKSKIVVDGFEFPAEADVAEMDWAEAKSIDVVVGADKRRVPLDTWLNLPLTSSAGAVVGKDAKWSDLFRDENGAVDAKIPKDKIVAVEIEPIRKGRLAVDGYQARGQFYSQAERPNSAAVAGWRLVARFKPAQPLKVDELAFSPDGTLLATSLQTFKVVGLDLTSGTEKLFPDSTTRRARFFAFTADGHLLVKEETADKRSKVMDWTIGKVFAPLPDSTPSTLGGNDRVASPTGDRVAIPSAGIIEVRDIAKDHVFRLARPEKDVGFVYRVGCFAPDGKRFAIGVEHPQKGGKVYVWDLIPGVGDKADSALPPRDVFVDRMSGFHFLCFSAAGDVVAASGKTSTGVRVWQLESGKEATIRLEGIVANVHALALSPDGKLAAISATPFSSQFAISPLTLRVTTDSRTPETLATLEGLRAPIHAVAFSRDGRRLAAGDSEGLVQVWAREP